MSFHKEKYWRRPKADGGDGGKGADVIIRADKNIWTLYDFKFRQHFFAASGGHGSSNRKKGRDAEDIIIRVPVGTLVSSLRTDCKLRELLSDGQEVVVANGGAGGKGSSHLKDRSADPSGKPGEEDELLLDLKLIADVGIVGFPNSGKSTLISSVSNARPKIASYPFTTKAPVLGVVEFKNYSFYAADIPGLIKDSHKGRGLGYQFLRHAERTKALIHLIDMAATDGRDPVNDYYAINNELKLYKEEFLKKPVIVAANKMDLPQAKDNLCRFKELVHIKVIPVSAKEKTGLKELLDVTTKKIFAHSS